MDFKELKAKAEAMKPEPVLLDVTAAGDLFQVEVSRLAGMDWSAIMVECPPLSAERAAVGYDLTRGALIACERHSRLLDAEGDEVEDVVWADLFELLSGSEVQGIAATWWALNMRDPNKRVVELKKASARGSETSLS